VDFFQFSEHQRAIFMDHTNAAFAKQSKDAIVAVRSASQPYPDGSSTVGLSAKGSSFCASMESSPT
jgi:hypothetical protein